jgi:hypothetical protein
MLVMAFGPDLEPRGPDILAPTRHRRPHHRYALSRQRRTTSADGLQELELEEAQHQDGIDRPGHGERSGHLAVQRVLDV